MADYSLIFLEPVEHDNAAHEQLSREKLLTQTSFTTNAGTRTFLIKLFGTPRDSHVGLVTMPTTSDSLAPGNIIALTKPPYLSVAVLWW